LPILPDLLRYQVLAALQYSFTPDALYLRQTRQLQNLGKKRILEGGANSLDKQWIIILFYFCIKEISYLLITSKYESSMIHWKTDYRNIFFAQLYTAFLKNN